MPPIDIDRDAARDAAEHELAKPIYPRPSAVDHLTDALQRMWGRLVDAGTTAVPGGWFTIVVLGILAAAGLVAVTRVARRTLRTAGDDHLDFRANELSAAEHRAAADRSAASGDWAEAIRHRLRAVARELEQAGIVTTAPGRTATELAYAAGVVLPPLADQLNRAARAFNDVSYGELPATPDGYRTVAGLDDQLRAITTPTHPAVTAVDLPEPVR